MQLQASTSGSYSESEPVLKQTVDRDARKPLLDLRLDLKPVVDDTESDWARQLVRRIETAYTRTLLPRDPWLRTPCEPVPDRESLLEFANTSGDWTLAVRIQTAGNTIMLDAEVGRDLYAFWWIRQRLY